MDATGMLEKARQGLWPSVAPLGYDNNRETKLIEPDPDRAPMIRELFQIYAAGQKSISELVTEGWELGLRSRKGFKVYKAALHKILLNPLFMGEFIWKGERFQGKHEPLVSREVWDEVQRVIHSRQRPRPHRLPFAFRGLLTCGHCGCSITGQIQKGKYVYYRCTRGRGGCQEKPVREEELAQQLGEPLKRLRLTPERVQWVVQTLQESHADEQALTASEQEHINHGIMIVRAKIDTLYEDRLKGLVPDDFWQRKFEEYQEEELRLRSRLERLQAAKGSYIEEGERILKLSQRTYSLYVSQNPDEQRKLVNILLSNCTLKDRTVSAELRKPFDVIADSVRQEEQLRGAKLPFSAANGNWLPRWGASANSNHGRTGLDF